MGFRVQLIAVSGKEPSTVQRDYGVVPTGQHEEVPELFVAMGGIRYDHAIPGAGPEASRARSNRLPAPESGPKRSNIN
jgi:hypothetical protein